MATNIFDELSNEAKLKQLNLSLDFIDERIYGCLTTLGIEPDNFNAGTWVRNDEVHAQNSHGAYLQNELERLITVRSFILSKRAAL
jgi:hypothetical protein